MKRHQLVWLTSLSLLVAAGCDNEGTAREDASEPVILDASLGFDGTFPDTGALLDAELSDAQTTEEDGSIGQDGGTSTGVEAEGGTPALDASLDAAAPADASGDASATAADAGADAAGEDAAAASDASAATDAGDASTVACASDNAGISLPPGFCATRFAENLSGPRLMVVTPAGDLFVANAPRAGASPSFVALRDSDHDGKADQRKEIGSTPGNGIDWRDGYLYFATSSSVLRYPLADGALEPSGAPVTLVRNLPSTPDHYHKTVLVSGTRLYVNIGTATNSCQRDNRQLESPGIDPCTELETRGGIWVFDANRANQVQADGTRFATGTRNANALALNAAGTLFTAQNSRDQLHENWPDAFSEADEQRLPAEGIFRLEQGDDYGWPYCYYDAEARSYFLAPEYGGNGELVGRCADIAQPVSTLPAHWAPLGMAFYEGTQFPGHYRRGAFIANHGSRFAPDAAEPLPGYNVAFIPFTPDGVATGPFERFAEGFAGAGRPLPDNAQHRPVGVAAGPDGALFVSDDKGGTIYRIVYRGE